MNWRKSTKCASAACVEVDTTGPAVRVRATGNPGDVVTVDQAAWRAFLAGLPDRT